MLNRCTMNVFLHRADGGSLSINPTTAASLTGVCTGSPAPYVFEDGPVCLLSSVRVRPQALSVTGYL